MDETQGPPDLDGEDAGGDFGACSPFKKGPHLVIGRMLISLPSRGRFGEVASSCSNAILCLSWLSLLLPKSLI